MDRITLKSVKSAAERTSEHLHTLGQLKESEELVVARDGGTIFLAVSTDEEPSDVNHEALVSVGFGGRLSSSTRESYYILAHLNAALSGWAADARHLRELNEMLEPSEQP